MFAFRCFSPRTRLGESAHARCMRDAQRAVALAASYAAAAAGDDEDDDEDMLALHFCASSPSLKKCQ